MLKRLDKKIRFRGHRREDSLDLDLDQSPLEQSPSTSDNECGDEAPTRDPEDLLDPDTPLLTDSQVGPDWVSSLLQSCVCVRACVCVRVRVCVCPGRCRCGRLRGPGLPEVGG